MEKKIKKKAYIYDLETFRDCFIACFISVDGKERHSFEISRRINQADELTDFLRLRCGLLIGFNNIGFDYPIIHDFLIHKNQNSIYYYNMAQRLINTRQYKYNVEFIPQLDLYRIWHLDNKAKRTSLKQIEFFLRHFNLQELPYAPDDRLSYRQIDEITEYCFNDCEATLSLYNITKEKIGLRKTLSNIYNLDLYNSSDSSIGEQIFIKYITNKTGLTYKELKAKVKSPKDFNFNLGEVILPYIKFESEAFKSAIDFFQYSNVEEGILKGKFNYSVNFDGLQYDFGAGGLHASKKGIFKTEGDYEIWDWDVNDE